jgi:hypothetical protein
MKTETELVCLNHFNNYQRISIEKRNKLPIDISPLYKPSKRMNLCCVALNSNHDVYTDVHDKDVILAVTWPLQ